MVYLFQTIEFLFFTDTKYNLPFASYLLIVSPHLLGIAGFADRHSCTKLLHAAETFARQHFVDVLQNEEFMSLTQRQLSRLIIDDELNVQCEERVFEAVLAWIKHDPETRSVRYVMRLLVGLSHALMNSNGYSNVIVSSLSRLCLKKI